MQKVSFHRSRITCFHACRSSWKHRNVLLSNADLNLVNFLHEELCSKNGIVNTSETLIIWSAFCYTAGFDKPWRNKRDVRPTAKRALVVFRVSSRHVEFLFAMFLSSMTFPVSNNRMLWPQMRIEWLVVYAMHADTECSHLTCLVTSHPWLGLV